jgi:serine/threonine protein kinase/Tfp pilus assembly protein PilF
MTPERWQQVEEIFHAALSRVESERMAFLVHTCAGDSALRLEVESLLAQQASTGGFLDGPAVAAAALLVSDTGASMLTGRRLGAYQVHERIGAGGMGEVYRARDTKLDRDVAIKILPRLFRTDPDRLTRFEREARVLASLNHPHIGAIYGLEEADGLRALILELVEGETLADRIARGPIPVQDAMTLAQQIAEALDAAHEKGIVHRDLKPENLFLTAAGYVKVLDFGLAQVEQGAAFDAATASGHPALTDPGAVLGTFGYMSPEQVRAYAVDARSDIFSLGCILYEMITGRRAFTRATRADTVAATLNEDLPKDWQTAQKVPHEVKRLIQHCVEKDPKDRCPSARDLALALRTILAGSVIALPHHHERHPQNTDAYRLYLKGRHYWNKRTEDGLRKSIAFFYQALDTEPDYAPAWAGLADAYHQLGLWGHAPPTTACPKAKSAALKAIQLDESLGEAHTTLAVILKDYDWDFVGAERAFRRALEFTPDQALTHQWYGECLACMGRHAEAIAQLRRAQELDPLSLSIGTTLARHGFFYAREYAEAAHQLRKTIATDPTFWIAQNFLGWVYLFQGLSVEALGAFEAARTLDDTPETLVGLGYCHATSGQPAKAQESLDALSELARHRYVAPVNLAVIYAGLGDKVQAFSWLEKACDDHSQWLSEIRVDPAFDSLRADQRFVTLLRRMNPTSSK